jgi:hypothetical protein
MVFRTAKNVITSYSELNVRTVIDLLVEKFYKLVIIITSIRHVLAAPSAVIHSAMVRKCIYKAVPFGIRVVVHAHRKSMEFSRIPVQMDISQIPKWIE